MNYFIKKNKVQLATILILIVGFLSCNNDDNQVEIEPEFVEVATKLTTKEILKTDDFSTVLSGGEFEIIGNDGAGNSGFFASEKGVYWGTTEGFQIDENNKTTEDGGIQDFTSTITGLEESTTYYVRAYATDGTTVVYANEDKSIVTDINPLNTNPFAGDLNLTTQAEVDAFDYTTVTGNLTISGADIINLLPLNTLIAVNGNLAINSNSALVTIRGLENLSSVGGNLSILNNSVLTTLAGLENVNTLKGNLEIGKDANNVASGNTLLHNFCEVSQLISNGQIESSEYFVDNNSFNPTHESIQGDGCKAPVAGHIFTFDSDTEGWMAADESTIISHANVDGRNVIRIESHPTITRTGGCLGGDKVGEGGLDVCIPNISPNGPDGVLNTADDNVYLKIVFRNNSNGNRLRVATPSGKVNRYASATDPYFTNPEWPTNNDGSNTAWLTTYIDLTNSKFAGNDITIGVHLVNQDSKSDVVTGYIEIDSWELTSTDQF